MKQVREIYWFLNSFIILVNPGVCPPKRLVCPPTRLHGGPVVCYSDGGCAYGEKCCEDICLGQKVCKPAIIKWVDNT